jgi:hypothetical protein
MNSLHHGNGAFGGAGDSGGGGGGFNDHSFGGDTSFCGSGFMLDVRTDSQILVLMQ